LHESDFAGVTPKRELVQTPNTVIGTPFSQRGGREGTTPGRFTPASATSATPGMSALQTPLRDKLNINAEDGMSEGSVDVNFARKQLRKSLAQLPRPKNDYEIVAPDDDKSETDSMDEGQFIPDAADVEAQKRKQLSEEAEQEWRRQCQSVQRDLPRPLDVNNAILRPAKAELPLSDLQKAEEMIKREMLIMLHHDAYYNPTAAQQSTGSDGSKGQSSSGKNVLNEEKHLQYMQKNRYEEFNEDQMEQARDLLAGETDIVKEAMSHGELTDDAFTQVWEECYAQVLYLPSQKRYTRAQAVSKKERIEGLQHKLEAYRGHMGKEAKTAAKMEKKLKVLLGGYQSRAQGLAKQLQDSYDQLEVMHVEKATFLQLKEREEVAIASRLQRATDEVIRQEAREKDLQIRYDRLGFEYEDLMLQEHRELATISVEPISYEQAANE